MNTIADADADGASYVTPLSYVDRLGSVWPTSRVAAPYVDGNYIYTYVRLANRQCP